ncbi:hypothetical protein ACXR2W_04675 [Leucobacter sp. HY1908]
MPMLPRVLLSASACAAVLASALVATPAIAAPHTVSTLAELQTAVSLCETNPVEVTLAADIYEPTTTLVTHCNAHIDLAERRLDVANIVIGTSTELTLSGTDSGTSTGTVETHVTQGYAPGISTAGATLTVLSGTVIARGAPNAAGIGGGLMVGPSAVDAGTLNVYGGRVEAYAAANSGYTAAIGGGYVEGSGGVLNIFGGDVYAQNDSAYGVAVGGGGAGASGNGGSGAAITVHSGGTLTAVANGFLSTAIGGGMGGFDATNAGGSGGSLTINEGGLVVASSPGTPFGGGQPGGLPASNFTGAFGSLTVDGTLSLPQGTLQVIDDPSTTTAEVTVGAAGIIRGTDTAPTEGAAIKAPGAGVLPSAPGTIANNGTIMLQPDASLVTGNNRLLTFNAPEASIPAQHVFAPSLTAAGLTLPAAPAGTLWNTQDDGLGSWFDATSSTAGSGTTDLYAVAPATLTVSAAPDDLVATAGVPFTYPVTVLSPGGGALDPQPALTATAVDCGDPSIVDTSTVPGQSVFETAGTCSLTVGAVVQGAQLTSTFEVRVVAAAAQALTLTPSAATVQQGDTVKFTVVGVDAYGNTADTSAAVLTSSVASDVVSGLTVTFPSASPHTITATVGAASAQAVIEVTPAQVPGPTPDPDQKPAQKPAQTPQPTAEQELASTGARNMGVAAAGSLLLAAAGAVGAVTLTRRRTRH